MGTVTEVVLHPGGIYFGGDDVRVRTLLGSCVAISVWHPRARVGGMCHFVVPSRGTHQRGAPPAPDGRYADEAMQLLAAHAETHCTALSEYQVHVHGGGNQFAADGPAGGIEVSGRNVEAARRLARTYGLDALTVDLGGEGARTVVLDLGTGIVTSSRAGTGVGTTA